MSLCNCLDRLQKNRNMYRHINQYFLKKHVQLHLRMRKVIESGAGTGKKDGFILISLLMFLLVISVVAISLVRNVTQELSVVQETVRLKQLETIVQSFMYTALQQEKFDGITEAVYQLEPLLPGRENVILRVMVHRDNTLGMRFLQVKAEDACNNEFSLRQCRVDFPEDLIQQLTQYSNILSAVQFEGNNPEGKYVTITSKSDGAAFPQFSAENIAAWASTDFPSLLELQRDGLNGWIYFSREKVSLSKGLTVHGKGILMFADEAVFADDSVFTDRIIVLADKDLIIGNNVRLDKALLLCQGKLTVGTDSLINGAVLTQQQVNLGNGTRVTVDTEVMEPYDSIISY